MNGKPLASHHSYGRLKYSEKTTDVLQREFGGLRIDSLVPTTAEQRSVSALSGGLTGETTEDASL